MTKAELAEIDDPDAPNEPEAMVGHRGASVAITPIEVRKRRGTMSAALAAGGTSDQIINAMANEYGMTEYATRNLMREVRALWNDDDAEAGQYERAAQKRRLLGHILKAVKAGKWTAVANLEKEYSAVSGTNQHDEDKPIEIDSRLSDSILGVIGAMDTKSVRIMIQEERLFVELTARDGTPGQAKRLAEAASEIIDVEGV